MDLGLNQKDGAFVLYGTPVEIPEQDEPMKKAVPVHEQIATDDRGRRRFHGAFTVQDTLILLARAKV